MEWPLYYGLCLGLLHLPHKPAGTQEVQLQTAQPPRHNLLSHLLINGNLKCWWYYVQHIVMTLQLDLLHHCFTVDEALFLN